MACRSTAKSPLSPPVQPPDPPAQSSPGMNRHSSQLCPLTARPVRLALPVSSMQPLFIIPSPPYKCLKGPQTPLPYCSTPAITGTLISPASAEMDGSCGNLEDTELRLGLPGIDVSLKLNKRALTDDCALKRPSSKAQVVGWPPVRSNRKNSFQTKRSAAAEATGAGIFVKVSMDGAPYLRKIDLKNYKGYKELRDALEDLFKIFSFSLDAAGTNGTEHTIAYEDKDGDWMLAGDVPWEMFISSCRRLRIMKGSEAKGLASNP